MKPLYLLLALLVGCSSADDADLDTAEQAQTAPAKDYVACFCTELTNAIVKGSDGNPRVYRGHSVECTAAGCDCGCKTTGTSAQ